MSYQQFLVKFRILFPEFSGITDAQLQIYYDQSVIVAPNCDNAILYLSAHFIALDTEYNTSGLGTATGSGIDGGEGEYTSESVDDTSVGIKPMAAKASDTFYTTTPYGRKYIIFRNACPSYRFAAKVYK